MHIGVRPGVEREDVVLAVPIDVAGGRGLAGQHEEVVPFLPQTRYRQVAEARAVTQVAFQGARNRVDHTDCSSDLPQAQGVGHQLRHDATHDVASRAEPPPPTTTADKPASDGHNAPAHQKCGHFHFPVCVVLGDVRPAEFGDVPVSAYIDLGANKRSVRSAAQNDGSDCHSLL